MKTLTRDLHGSNRYTPRAKQPATKKPRKSGYDREQVRKSRLKLAGIPQIEDSHLLDAKPPGRKKEAELAKIIADACEQFRPNHMPAPERVAVVEEVDCDD